MNHKPDAMADRPLTLEPHDSPLTPEEEAERLWNEMRARGESVLDKDVLPEFALG